MHTYTFGDYRLEEAEHRLTRDGEEVPLRPKVFDTLVALVRSAGRLVDKAELYRAVWPDTVVEEGNLAPENAARLLETLGTIDVVDLLPEVSVPTLVTHSRGDAGVPFVAGRALAEGIPGARFLPLESDNHLILAHEPAWPIWRSAVRGFLAADAVDTTSSGGDP